jgi:hypothetical protein
MRIGLFMDEIWWRNGKCLLDERQLSDTTMRNKKAIIATIKADYLLEYKNKITSVLFFRN